jgi:UDP-glucose 4-epimerase
MKYLVTGGAGFIGSNLVDNLLADPSCTGVRVVDNLSSGRREHLAAHDSDSRFEIVVCDLLDLDGIAGAFKGVDIVYHLAANPDPRWGLENTRLDLEQETIATYNVLEAMRRNDCKRILFSSSGTVYGDIGTTPGVETYGPCLPISLYGAGKAASEALVSAFCGTFGFSSIMFRFGNIVGHRTTHGVIFDFFRKLAIDPRSLEVLGDGHQAKPYVFVLDLIRALRHLEGVLGTVPAGHCDVFNIAPDGATSVRFIAETLLRLLGMQTTKIHYGDLPQGWPGDVAQVRIDSQKLAMSGFALPRSSDDAVKTAIESVIAWVRERPAEAVGLRVPVPK